MDILFEPILSICGTIILCLVAYLYGLKCEINDMKHKMNLLEEEKKKFLS